MLLSFLLLCTSIKRAVLWHGYIAPIGMVVWVVVGRGTVLGSEDRGTGNGNSTSTDSSNDGSKDSVR
ncbi:hypothetical protein COM33_19210 [Bacillus toyonensis]|nr:hypothetical protein TU60_26285 [Bacillus toyonensis]KXY19464.1 hypothetical protein AT259_16600 [Bacillus cereus]PEL67776.1 hypothetical protein CN637_17765 [Bacillus toyonensis]PGD42718.1 hypothetical protein COM33_19210 [Bacillus toyonensis]PGD87451.1 hypothetical protein COM36_04750 [Bacillus toyonensis]